MEKTIKVEGMKCPNCERHVREALEKVAGVESVVADRETATAVVQATDAFDAAAAEAAVVEAGYKFLGVE